MTEAFIGRQSAIGLGLETTHGTKANPKVWIPKTSGVLNPSTESATDDSGYGVIDEVFDSFTTKNSSSLALEGIVRNDFIGYLLLGSLGKYTKLTEVKGTATGGTPKRGDVTTNGAVLKKIVKIGNDIHYFFDKAVSSPISNGTWTITGTVGTMKAHFFERLNSNQHPSFTLYDNDPVASSYASYSMINSFEISCEVADYMKFSAEFMGKQMKAVEGTLTPAYADEGAFTASMAGVKFADNEVGLNTATEICMQNFRISINKNITDIQCFGSTDIDSLYNQQFGIEGDFEALYNDTTLRDLALDSTKKAVRFYAQDTNSDSFSAIYVDIMKAGLNEWTKTDGNNDIIKQTMGFVGQYDNETNASIEILLINNNSTGYNS